MTRQSCVSLSIRRGQLSNKKKNPFPFSISNFFYSFCPLELSICINAVGNPIKWTMRICRINCVSCRHLLCIFNIFSLEQMCLASDKRRTIILASTVMLMMVIVFSLSLQGRCTGQTAMFKKEKKRNWTLIAFVQHHLFFSSRLVVCQSERMRVVQLEHDCEKKNDSILFLLSSHKL
jgi:hypothetical protein